MRYFFVLLAAITCSFSHAQETSILHYCVHASKSGEKIEVGENASVDCAMHSAGKLVVKKSAELSGSLFSHDELKLDDFVGLTGSIYSNDKVKIEEEGTVSGNVVAQGDIKLKKFVIVQGDVISGVKIDTEQGVVIVGNAAENAVVTDVPIVPVVPISVQTGSYDIEVDENDSLELAPGIYGKIKLKKNSELTLVSGTYSFEEFVTEEDTVIYHQITSSSVLVDVEKKIEIGEDAQVLVVGGTGSSILYTSEGDDIKFKKDALIIGSFIAGAGKIVAEERVVITGALYAEAVILKKDVQLIGQPAFKAIDERFSGTVLPPNTPPVANAGVDQVAFSGDSVTLDGSDSYDMDGDPLSFQWLLESAPATSQSTLSDPTAVMPVFEVDSVGEYRIQLVVNDGAEDSEFDEVIVTTENSQPVADAGPNQSVFVGELVALDGSNSSDANGDSLTYAWLITTLPEGSLAELTDSDTANPSFSVDISGQYQVDLIVSDGSVDSDVSTVLINAEFPNTPPIADAGTDQTVDTGSDVNLDGSLSSDSDGDDITYAWSLIVVPDQSITALDDPTSVSPQFTADKIGQYVVQLITNDGVDDSEPSTLVVSAVDPLPDLSISISSPADFSYTNVETITVSGSLNRPAVVIINGNNVTVNENLEFTTSVDLQEGENTILIQASNADVDQNDFVTLTVTLDTQIPGAPVSESISAVQDGSEISITGDAGSVEAGTYVSISNLSTSESVTVQADETGSFNASLTGEAGDEFSVVVTDAAGNISDPTLIIGQGTLVLPPEPETVAPPLDPVAPTPMHESVQFLYTGANPIQTGVDPDAIKPAKVVVVKGELQDFDGSSITGVEISVVGQPELGKTLSRATGKFDLVLNGGGISILEFRKNGYLTSQRKVQPKRRTFFSLEPVVLVALDPEVTVVALGENTPTQFAAGSTVTDQDGARTARLVVPAGTGASMLLPDGSSQPLDNLSFRATEFTVGTSGSNAMPGELPVETGYTYAVELTADEAIAAGASRIDFNQPVYLLVDNFIGFPTGSAVPAGYYDREMASWIPSDNGVVIGVLAIENGQAVLDISGSGQAASEAELTALGFNDAELAQIATKYAVRASLWRVPITHFTPWDCNWPAGPPDDASPPPESDNNDDEDEPDCEEGSVIECQNQTLRESLQLHGTPYRLHYSSSRVPGRLIGRKLKLVITNAVVPDSLKRVELEIETAGVKTAVSFSPEPNQTYEYEWNGKDAFNRDVIGTRNARVSISYVYEAQFYEPAEFEQSFSQFSDSGTRITGTRTTNEIYLTTDQNFAVSKWTGSAKGIGGWTISGHHNYDPVYQVLYRGDGTKFGAEDSFKNIETVAGIGTVAGYDGDNGPARLATLRYPNAVKFDQQGNLIIADSANHTIRRVNDNGIITTVAGQGYCGFSGDEGPAINAEMCFPKALAIGPDNSIYVSDYNNARVRRIYPDGSINTIAGGGTLYPDYTDVHQFDGYPATDIALDVDRIAVSPNGDLYLGFQYEGFVAKVTQSGLFTAVAGGGAIYGSAATDGMPATAVGLDAPHGIAIKPNGNLIIAEGYGSRIREVGQDGIITTIAGTGEFGYSGDGGPATEAEIGDTLALEVSPTGEVYFVQYLDGCVRKIDNNGIISSVAGICEFTNDFSGDGGPSRQAVFNLPLDLAISPEGQIYIADTSNHVIRRERFPLPGFSADDYAVASPDTTELFQFDAKGVHLATYNTLTGHKMMEFAYDSAGYLTSIYDADNNQTIIERAGEVISGVLSEYGQQSLIDIDANGYLSSITDPAGATIQFFYGVGGLMTSMTDANENIHEYVYNAAGRLEQDINPNGGIASLRRSETSEGYEVTFTTAENQVSRYRVTNSGNGDESSTKVNSDGSSLTTTRSSDGRTIVSKSTGYLSNVNWGGDPRFYLNTPYVLNEEESTSAGLSRSHINTQQVEVADSNNPLSLISRTITESVNGSQSTRIYTASDKRSERQSAEGRLSEETIDFSGRVLHRSQQGLSPVEISYDAHGRFIAEIVGSGQDARTISQDYDSNGYISQIVDAASLVTTFPERDENGRVLKKVLPGGRSVEYRYDPNGNIMSIAPPSGSIHSFTYNSNNQVATYEPPATVDVPATATTYSYDLDRRLVSVTRPDGMGYTITYGVGTNLIENVTTPDGLYSVLYEAEDDKPTLLSTPGNIQLGIEYDAFLPTRYEWAGDVSGVLEQSHDNYFRVASHKVNTQPPIDYAYDNDQLLISAGDMSIVRESQKSGLVASTTLGGIDSEYTYNEFGELSTYIARFNGTIVYEINLDRGPGGRITRKEEFINGNSIDELYAYDESGRLESVTRNGSSSNFVYDGNGNRLSLATATGVLLGTYDEQDRLLSYAGATYNYTASGDLTNVTNNPVSGNTQLVYDVLGNLTKFTTNEGKVIDYELDGNNSRVGKYTDGTLVQGFLYKDRLNPIAELDGAGGVVSEFVYGDQNHVPAYLRRGDVNYQIITDHLGSPRLIVNATDGSIEQQIDYDSFGIVLTDTNPGFQPFGFAGGLYDHETGLVRFGKRDYDAQIGRWTTKDPIYFDGGINLYAYVDNDPISYIDEDGEAGKKSPRTICINCGAIHGGVRGVYCPSCYDKSKDPKGGVPPLIIEIDKLKICPK